MYNLLMRQSFNRNDWEANQGRPYDASFLSGRVFEHTADVIREQFSLPHNNAPDFETLTKLPCLFTYEGADVTGYIRHISRVIPQGKRLEITYTIPEQYPKLHLNDEDMFESLGVNRFEKSRTHWAVKAVDLFEFTTTMLHNHGGVRVLLSGTEMKRVWGDNYQQGRLVFLSHRTEHRRQVASVKEALESEGLSCFLAHQDIAPSSIWQNEIINALNTMDAFVGFVTDDFHGGGWTDQEVGYAHKRGVHRVFVKLGSVDPAGMVATEQALRTDWEHAANHILTHLKDVGVL